MRFLRSLMFVTAAVISTCCVSCGVDESTLSGIEIEKGPNKTYYLIGEQLDITGMKVVGHYANNARKEIRAYTYSPGGRPLTVNDNLITVQYKNYFATYPITVGTQPSPDVSEYYKSISNNLSGTQLLSALQTLNSSMKKKSVSYDDMRFFAKKCDAHPDQPGKIVGFYNNKIMSGQWDGGDTWNREHVWPDSLGGGSVENDAFMPRPCDAKINSKRGNNFFAASGAYDPADCGIENYRGICARIIFYCVVSSSNLKIIDSASGSGHVMGKLSDLLKWNLQYTPSTSPTAALELRVEQNRNNVIQRDSEGQGNRNPFVDHPEYACRIWGGTNSETRRVCGM